GYLNINVTMVAGTGAQTQLCKSASGTSGVLITSTSYLPYSISCTPPSPVFVPSGYKIRVYMNVYNTGGSRTYRHRFNNVAANGTLTLTAARLGAINVTLTAPASDTSIPLAQSSTATCLVNGMTSGQQAAGINVTLLESYDNATYFAMAAAGQNITTSSTNPTATSDLPANTTYNFNLFGANPSVDNYLKCGIQSDFNQSYNCSAAACAITQLGALSPLPARRVNVTLNATLSIWDSNDTQGGGATVYPGDNAVFYANFSYANGSPISAGSCNIAYYDNAFSAMAYNATSKLFNANRAFSSSGNFTYNVSCNSGSVFVNASSTIQIAPIQALSVSAWDSTKPAGGSQQIAPGNTSYFYANFTSQAGPVANGTCNMSYYDNTSAIMSYNASNGVYYSSRSFAVPGTFAYNATCYAYGQNASDNSTISVAPLTCNSPPRPKSDYPAGLVSYWSFDKNTSDDYGPNNGVAYGAMLSCGEVSGAYDYYTRSDRVVVPASPSLYLPENGTYELLIRPRSILGWEGLMHKGQLASFADEDISLQYNGASSVYTIFYDTTNAQYANTGPGSIPFGGWNHYVLSWNSTNSWVFLNGAFYMTSSKPGLIRDSGGSLQIGAQINQSYDSTYQMLGIDGQIDEAAVYSTSMNATTAQEHYNDTLKAFNYFPLRPNITMSVSPPALYGVATFIDPDGDPLNYSYRWYKNGVLFSSGNSAPYNFPQGVQMNISNQTSINDGENWTLEVWATDGKAVSQPINSTPFTVHMAYPIALSVFSSTDPQGGNLTLYAGQQAGFFANLTLLPNNTSVSGASCNITYHDGANASMAYNATSGLYYSSRTYNFTGNYTYNVSCKYGATAANASGNVLISAAMFISSSKPAYSSCGSVFYSATTVTPLSVPVDTALNVSINDPFANQPQLDAYSAGNAGTGIYYG
ncbi:MAG TPA: LamG domain-containing protein, partial [Candidatus Micrarchaeota archaeon]|nr:LamG domain-containing protein [Candidatus Micrarchaeota archaeon]